MNCKEIQRRWEAGEKEVAVRLLQSMIYELGLRQCSLREFREGFKHKKENKDSGHGC